MSLSGIYRLIAYYVSLALFGLFGVTLNAFCLLTAWLPGAPRRAPFYRRLIQRHFRAFLWWGSVLRLFHVRIHGFERIPAGGCVLIANHPGLMDATFLLAQLPDAICLYKPAIRRNPVLAVSARCAGYIAADGGHDSIRLAAEYVRAGATLIIFPEGTRTPPGHALLPLNPGFALIARYADRPIQLVRITTDSIILGKGRALWRPARLPANFDITLGPTVRLGPGHSARATIPLIEAWFRGDPDAAACLARAPAVSSPLPAP